MFRTKTIYTDAQFPNIEMPFARSAMPSRPRKQGVRNLTGIFSGAETSKVRELKSSVPPLARGRGMPSHKIRTPTEERRYKKVELLRTKEEKRGFSGNPLKRRQRVVDDDFQQQNLYFNPSDQLTFWDITRQTARKYTAANNAGVTHLEYLNQGKSHEEARAASSMAEQIHKAALDRKEIIGVIDCYQKICRSNVQTLLSLLPAESQHHTQTSKSALAFQVKSYRNPSKAEIMACFPDNNRKRPKTVVGTTRQRPTSKTYFYSNQQLQSKSSLGHYREFQFTPHTQVAEGRRLSGSVSEGDLKSVVREDTLLHVWKDTAPLSTVAKKNSNPRESSSYQDISSLETSFRGITVPSTEGQGKELPKSEGNKKEGAEVEEPVDCAVKDEVFLPVFSESDDSPSSDPYEGLEGAVGYAAGYTPPQVMSEALTEGPTGNKLQKMPSGSDIVIGLEDESGEQCPLEIDETDECIDEVDDRVPELTMRRKVSINERILKSRHSEQEAAHLTQDAEVRKRFVTDLLDDLMHISHEVNSLQLSGGKASQESK